MTDGRTDATKCIISPASQLMNIAFGMAGLSQYTLVCSVQKGDMIAGWKVIVLYWIMESIMIHVFTQTVQEML